MRSMIRADRRSTYRHSSPSSRRSRAGFTLLEILIATAVTLLMMISMVQVFKVIGDSMKQGRATLQMNSNLRAVTTRLRQDLANLTVRVDPPLEPTSGGGYFEYYDGSMTDYTAALYADDAPVSNRFGDTDDILMFTARAGSAWFTGQVPTYIISPPVPPAAPDPTPVLITSQLAEIAVFARPVLSPGTVGPFDDADGNNFPDRFRLHYRVLLIRPDLNSVTTGSVPTLPVMSIASASDTPLSMASFFATCDLSMHRVYDSNPGLADQIAANSLEDLSNPANRFAHYQYSLAGLGTAGSATMPLLVLDTIDQASLTVRSKSGIYSDPNPTAAPAQVRNAHGIYLAPEYVLAGTRQGEDVIANNVLAFDVKGYDPGVPIIATPGPDGAFSTPIGADGGDDLILTPNDPGYAAAYDGTVSTVAYGEYVDLMWGRKALASLAGYSLVWGDISAASPNFFTGLSGIVDATPTYSDGLLRSGKVLQRPLASISIVQPTFDTWTTAYESDGLFQTYLRNYTLPTDRGIIDVNGFFNKNHIGGLDAVPTGSTDLGVDGIDNNLAGGVDETAERETLPPFPMKLRGVKVSVRIDDANTRQIKQMSVVNEFATQ